MCNLCSRPDWSGLCRHTSTFARTPKTSNHVWKSYRDHAVSSVHLRILSWLGAIRTRAGMEDHVTIHAGPCVPSPAADPVVALRNCCMLFISTIMSHGSVSDFGQKLSEQALISPGSVGNVTDGSSYRQLAATIQKACDDVMLAELQAELRQVSNIALGADEPKGVYRYARILVKPPSHTTLAQTCITFSFLFLSIKISKRHFPGFNLYFQSSVPLAISKSHFIS